MLFSEADRGEKLSIKHIRSNIAPHLWLSDKKHLESLVAGKHNQRNNQGVQSNRFNGGKWKITGMKIKQ